MARITPCLENGKIARYVPDDEHHGPAFGSTEFIVIRGREGLTDNDFAFHLTRWSEFRSFAIAQMSGSSGRQRVPAKSLAGFEVPVPPLPEQRAIAHILGTLDDKIELNRRMNQTLEAIAQALFKSWFVDFDPVVVNAIKAGNPIPDKFAERAARYGRGASRPDDALGLPEHILALFPDRFVDSELGLIPEGWKVKRIGEVVKRISVGKKYSQKTAKNFGKVPILDQGKSGIIGYHDEEPGVKASPKNPVIVFANHTCYMRLIMHDFSAIQNVLPFKGIELDIFWLYCATYGKQKFIEYKGHWPDFIIHELVVPVGGLDGTFGTIVEDLFRKVFANEQQNNTLSYLCDTLLPKLISGELRVPDVEKFIDEVEI